MATLDRIEPAYGPPWTPSVGGMATEHDYYIGRHRRPDTMRMFSVRRLFRAARHRAR